MQVVIIGGGYAGLTVAIELKKKQPHVHVTLIDKKSYFLPTTQLHKTVTEKLEKFKISYSSISKRFDFHFIQDECFLDSQTIGRLNQERALPTTAGILEFDALVLATGSLPYLPVRSDGNSLWSLLDIANLELSQKLNQLPPASSITICGAGSSGVQFLAEIATNYPQKFQLSLINFAETILDQYPLTFHRYVMDKLNHWQVTYFPLTVLEKVNSQELILRNRVSGELTTLKSDLTLLLTGVNPSPFKITADSWGRVWQQGKLLEAIYTAGDCSYFATGLNSLTAQAALRKAKIVAHNIIDKKHPKPYLFKELGYFISLGTKDAIGYLWDHTLTIQGLPGWLTKNAIEQQWELYLNGIDTFIL